MDNFKNEIFENLIGEVSKCCLGEDQCGSCEKDKCLIGYCNKCLVTALKQQDWFISGGMDKLPSYDTRFYDDEVVVDAIGYLLNQCRNCSLYHDEECIINIIRSALEIILLGEVQEYRGSVLVYLNDIKKVNEKMANRILEAFYRRKSEWMPELKR